MRVVDILATATTLVIFLPGTLARNLQCGSPIVPSCDWGAGKWQDFWDMRDALCEHATNTNTEHTVKGPYQNTMAYFMPKKSSDYAIHCWDAMQDIIEFCLDTSNGSGNAIGSWCNNDNRDECYQIVGNPNIGTDDKCENTH